MKGVSNTPSRERLFVCQPASAAEEPPCADEDSDEPRAPRLPAARDGGRRRGAAGVLQADARERPRLRRRHPRRRRAHPVEPVVPVSHRTRSGRRPAGRGAPGQRPRARLAPVVLPLEQHPGPEAAEPGRGRPAARAGRACRAGAPHDRGRARRRPGQQLHRAVAAAAQPGSRRSLRTCCCSPISTTTPARRSAARPSCSSRTSCARTAARWSC